jgi:hypothetical protein
VFLPIQRRGEPEANVATVVIQAIVRQKIDTVVGHVHRQQRKLPFATAPPMVPAPVGPGSGEADMNDAALRGGVTHLHRVDAAITFGEQVVRACSVSGIPTRQPNSIRRAITCATPTSPFAFFSCMLRCRADVE